MGNTPQYQSDEKQASRNGLAFQKQVEQACEKQDCTARADGNLHHEQGTLPPTTIEAEQAGDSLDKPRIDAQDDGKCASTNPRYKIGGADRHTSEHIQADCLQCFQCCHGSIVRKRSH